MRWAELLDENMPQELHRSIEEQKAACAEIVASKVPITLLQFMLLMCSSEPVRKAERAEKERPPTVTAQQHRPCWRRQHAMYSHLQRGRAKLHI